MRQFKKLVAVEEKQLEKLWQQWTEVQQKIRDAVLEMLDPRGLELLLAHQANELQDHISPHRKVLIDELERERRKWDDQVLEIGNETVAKMKASEEVWPEGVLVQPPKLIMDLALCSGDELPTKQTEGKYIPVIRHRHLVRNGY